MTTNMLRKAVQLFPVRDHIPLARAKYLRRKWLVGINTLGKNWVLAEKVQRK